MEELKINLMIAIGIVYFVVAGSILSIGFYVFQNIIIVDILPRLKLLGFWVQTTPPSM